MDCLACDLASGRLPLPGGLIHQTESWRVEHCVGPLAGRMPAARRCNIHYVVQPVTRELTERYEAHGPRLQAAMFQAEASPPADAVEQFAECARAALESA